jgi:hypothetical protein
VWPVSGTPETNLQLTVPERHYPHGVLSIAIYFCLQFSLLGKFYFWETATEKSDWGESKFRNTLFKLIYESQLVSVQFLKQRCYP